VVSRVLGVAVEPSRVRAVALGNGRVVWAAEAGFENGAELADVLARLASERPVGIRAARVALSTGVAQLKVVTMPRLAERDLAAHVAIQPRRYFLQNGAALVTDAVPLPGPRRNGHPPALLAAAPEPLVEAVAAGVAAAGMRLAGIAPTAAFPATVLAQAPTALAELDGRGPQYFAAYAAAAAEPALELLPTALRQLAIRANRRSTRRWTAACVGSLLLAAVSAASAPLRTQGAAVRELALLGPSVERALASRRDLDQTTDALGVLARAEADRSHVARLLADLASALGDSVFLAVLRLNPDGRNVLVGYAAHTGEVLSAMGSVPEIADPELEGSVTRETAGAREWERFTIRFRLAWARGDL
jgi:hypothetical protein